MPRFSTQLRVLRYLGDLGSWLQMRLWHLLQSIICNSMMFDRIALFVALSFIKVYASFASRCLCSERLSPDWTSWQ